MAKYILIRVNDDLTLKPVIYFIKQALQDVAPFTECIGEDLYYGFENCAENLNNVTMFSIGDEPDEE